MGVIIGNNLYIFLGSKLEIDDVSISEDTPTNGTLESGNNVALVDVDEDPLICAAGFVENDTVTDVKKFVARAEIVFMKSGK